MTYNQILIKIFCLLGHAIDINPKGKWPSNALDNSYPHRFKINDMWCNSMDEFLQSLKTPSLSEQMEICGLSVKEAQMRSSDSRKVDKIVFLNDEPDIIHENNQFKEPVRKAYRAMIEQCPEFKEALKATGNKVLFYSKARTIQTDTILTGKELCNILTELRFEIQLNDIFDEFEIKNCDTSKLNDK